MAADRIPSIDEDALVVRLEGLAATHRARLAELSEQRDRIAMTDEAAALNARAQALAEGGAFEPTPTLDAINDESAVIRTALARLAMQVVDARSLATARITRDERLVQRAAESRAQVGAAIDSLIKALDRAAALASAMEAAGLSAAGARWTGGAPSILIESLAGLRLDCGGVDAATMTALERRASRRVDPVFVAQDRPAPVIAKSSIRKRIANKLDEIGEQMFV